MAKSKYDPDTFPILAEGWARQGLTDEQIAKNLGISESTLNTYKQKYPEFLESLKKGKGPVDIEVENAFLKRALGYTYNEVHENTKTESIRKKDGTILVTKIFEDTRIITKHVMPDVAAAFIWLKNRMPERWRDKIEPDGSDEQNLADLMTEYAKLIREGDLYPF